MRDRIFTDKMALDDMDNDLADLEAVEGGALAFANIYEALAWVMGQVNVRKNGEFRGGYTSKNGERRNISYGFRRIEDYYAALNPLLARAGIIYTQEFVGQTNEKGQEVYILEDRAQVNGLPGRNYRILIRSTFTHVSGTSISTMYAGEAGGNDDKSLAKAQSVAYKICMEKTFCVPVERTEDESTSNVEFSEEIAPEKWQNIYQPQYYKLCGALFAGDWTALMADMKKTLGINFDRIGHLGEGHVKQYLRAAQRRVRAARESAGQPGAGIEAGQDGGNAGQPESVARRSMPGAGTGGAASPAEPRNVNDMPEQEPEWMREVPPSEPQPAPAPAVDAGQPESVAPMPQAMPGDAGPDQPRNVADAQPPAPSRKKAAPDPRRKIMEDLLDALCRRDFNNNRARLLADMRDFLNRDFARVRDLDDKEISSYLNAQGEKGREQRRQLLERAAQMADAEFGGDQDLMSRHIGHFLCRSVYHLAQLSNDEIEKYLCHMESRGASGMSIIPGVKPPQKKVITYGDEIIECGEDNS